MILDDVLESVTEKAMELDVEGINTVVHYIRRLDVNEDDFHEFVERRARAAYEIGLAGNSIETVLKSCWIDAFIIGLMTGRRGGRGTA